MTRQEFETRAMAVTAEEFDAINLVYMNCDLDKDEFCKVWVKMNASRVKAFKAARLRKERRSEALQRIADKLYQADRRNGWTLAEAILTDKQKQMLEEENITIGKLFCYSVALHIERYINK